MTKKILIGAILSLIFTVSMMIPISAVDHLSLDKVETKNNGANAKVEVTTVGNFEAGAGAFGLVACGTTGCIGVVTHGGVGPDSEVQANAADAVFHTHLITTHNIGACISGANPTGLAVWSASFAESGKLEVKGNSIEIKNIPFADVGTMDGDVTTFTLRPLGNLPLPDHICIDVVETAFTDD